ncbi:MAG: hypothetical protein ACI37Q_01510 [Candidatus Gastranaerophilaceae bacterium]
MRKNNNTNIFTSLMILSLLSQQALIFPVCANASNITGVTPAGGANGEFNIKPDVIKDDLGFRHYNDFNLSEGDIVNLIFTKNNNIDMTKFINLVDNRININGIVNTLNQQGSFYNGNAVFVSPNGMVVGASGVLNVGSLTAIAPAPLDYLKYTGHYMGRSVLDNAGSVLRIDTSDIDITNDSVNLKLLKESDPVSDITVQGKIFARDSVELIGKHVNIGNTSDVRAGIFAGLPTEHDVKMQTINQANELFNTLVTTNIKQGTGFDRDALGNIIIKAQSNKVAQLADTDTLIVKGMEYAIDELFKVVDSKIVVKDDSELSAYGLASEDVLNAWSLALQNCIPSDASDPEMINTKNAATVTINNAVLGGKNVDVNAISKVTYTAQKGSSLFDRMVNTIIDETGSTTADILLDSITLTDSRLDTFEGSRAKAAVEIGENATLFATKDVDVKSLAMAETAIKVKSLGSPLMDTTESFYFLGTKTDSSVIVQDKAELIAGEDVNVLAASKNVMNLKIKNPTSKLDLAGAKVANVPSLQVSFLQAVNEADTVAEVQKGATINAGQDVNVTASNFTSDQSVLQAVANVNSPAGGTSNAGLAVAVTLKDTDINTSAILDNAVEAGNDVNVNAQNMHVSYTSSETKVGKSNPVTNLIAGKIADKVTNVIGKKVSGIQEGLNSLAAAGSMLPSASVSLVVNDSDVNATAKIGKNADIDAGNDVNVNSVIVDTVVNTSSAKSEIEPDTTGTTSYIPTGGVSVIVNNQNNNAVALIEDGIFQNHAKIVAGNDISVNATTEQPMNDATFALGLNLLQTFEDTKDMFEESSDIATHTFDYDNPDWDFRVVMEELKSVTGEEMYDIKSIMFGVKNAGITTLGLKGFFNNWAESKAKDPNAIGLAASVVVSDVLNNTNARIGNYAELDSKNTLVNAANSVVQFNAAGDISSLWSIIGDTQGQSGMGGTVIVESVDSRAISEIEDNATITASDDVSVTSANDQDFLTVAMTGSKATSNMGISISGSTIVQDVKGKTESSVGSSTINAKKLDVVAGSAKISKVPTALEQLQNNPFENLDSDHFEVGLEDGMEAAEIRRFTDTDTSVGIDTELGYDAQDITNPSVISGTGLAPLNPAVTISDSISNIMISGALSTQKSSVPSSSSGVAFGASVNVSEFAREVNALINDGATIELSDSLNVLADSKTQSLNLALAGAFAGGISLKPATSGSGGSGGGSTSNKVDSFLSKITNSLSKTDKVLGDSEDSPTDSGKLDSNGNPILTYKGEEYKTSEGSSVYKTKDNKILTDSSGNAIKANSTLGSNSLSNTKLTNQGSSKTTSTKNLSAAMAGSVNAQINKSTVKAEVGAATITVSKDVNVKAIQKTGALNIGGGVAKASTVGAGAAVNVIENSNETVARVTGANVDFKNNSNALNVFAQENNDNVQVAIGVGATKNNPPANSSASVALGGSFNTDVLTNSVTAEIVGSTIENIEGLNSILVDVNAENHSTSYKGAGGMSLNISGNNSIGGSIAGNINAIQKTTTSKIDSTTITNAKNVTVISNKDKSIPTENIIDVGVSGSVVAGITQSSYTFTGAMSTNVISNEIYAQIMNGSVITATGDIDVIANSHYKNWSAAGALGFSSASKGAGVGAGSIVNVINSNIKAEILSSTINNSNSADVLSYHYDDLNFVAINMGIQTAGGSTVNANGIVNVVNSKIYSDIIGSTLQTNSDLSVLSDYHASIFGVTNVGSGSRSGWAVGANILSNTLLADNTSQINNSNITSSGKTTVKATSNEKIDVTPVAVAVTVTGTAAAAANVGVNVVNNTTQAYIDNSAISSAGIEVTASDDTQAQTRGGTLGVTQGTVALAGSILSDTYVKNVKAYIDNTVISKGGDIDVSATAKNIFGMENPGSITMSALADDINDGDYDVSNDLRFDKWDINFDVSASSNVGVSGSIISKVVTNDIDAYIGSGTTIQKATTLDVDASNSTSVASVIGNVSAAGGEAIGATIFSNVNTSAVNAGIKEGAKILNVGDINIDASSTQDYHALNFVVGAASTAAVTGAVNTNIIVNETNAYIGKGANITSTGALTISADDSVDIQALQVAVEASSTASVGAISNVNVFNNNVNAIVGKNSDTSVDKVGTVSASGDINIKATSEENYQANVTMVSASGVAAVSGVVVSNTMASDIAAGIEEMTVTSSAGSITLNAENSFNEKNKNQTSGVRDLLSNNSELDTDDLEAVNVIPLVSILNIAASGSASVSGTVVNSNVISEVEAYVRNAEVKSDSGLNVNALSQMTTYDAVMGISASAYAAVPVTGVVNVYSGTTKAEILNSTIEGSVLADAKDIFNLNTIFFTAGVAAMGASVVPVINTNTIANDVFADIINSNISGASTISVSADNKINITDGVVAAAITGVGAAVTVIPITNVFAGNTRASLQDTSVTGTSVDVDITAKNTINNSSVILGAAGAGIGASVSGYAMVNVFDNDLDAYIKNSTISKAASVDTVANSDLDMAGIMASDGVNGVGTSVIVNTTTNVIQNRVNSYIDSSTITNGSILTKAIQNANVLSNNSSVGVNGIGNSTVVNSLVNVFTNDLNAYISNTVTNNVSEITVSTDADEVLNNSNIGIAGSGTVANVANSIVNVLENKSWAYIDAKDKTMNVTGEIKVSSEDDLSLTNSMGMAVGSGLVAAGANINVNVLNNAVKAEVLSSSGSITAGNLDIDATSNMYLNEGFVSAAAGLVGIAGNVIINSIGSKVNQDNDALKVANISGTITSANQNYKKNVQGINYEKGGQQKNIDNAYSLTGTSSNATGTIANLNANITTSNSKGIDIDAKNVVKGNGAGGALSLTNVTTAAGQYAVGASVLFNDMNYNTSAKISGGDVDVQNADIDINANSGLKAAIYSKQATVGVKGIAGNVGYTNNEAVTQAIIENATVSANDININAKSSDNIDVNVQSATVSGASAKVSVGIAETNNQVNAKISGTNGVDINAKNININADNTSSISSKLESIEVSGVSFTTAVNRTTSNALTQALIDASGTVDADNDINIIAQSNGISATTTMKLGSVSLAGVGFNQQGAYVKSEFKAGVDNDNLEITSKSTNIKSGVNSLNNNNAAEMKAEVLSEKASVSLAEASVTNLTAEVNAKTTAVSNAKLHKSDNISLISKLKRVANVGSSTKALGAISLGSINLSAKATGDNNIEVDGNHQVTNNFDIDLSDVANTNTKMINADVTLAEASFNSADSLIQNTATINFGGNVAAKNVNINNNIEKSSFNTADSDSKGLVQAGVYKFTTQSSGDSNVNITANMTDTNYANNLSVTSTAKNNAESILSDKKVALIAIAKDTSKNELSANNYINITDANIKSKGTVKLATSADNNALMKKKSTGGGLVIFSGGELQNNVLANAKITTQNSSVTAKNIYLETLSNIGSADADSSKTIYTVDYSGSGIRFDNATINNTVNQSSIIDINSSDFLATDTMNVNAKTTSNYIQGIESDGQGFVAKNTATSTLTVGNRNEVNIDSASTLFANDMKISLDSSNTLKSYVDIDVSHFGGRDPIGKSYLTLRVDNDVINYGSIKGGNSVEIDFMKNSYNNLTQESTVVVEAAVATGDSKGSLTYVTDNNLTVAQGADITASKDVIANYTSGTNSLSSKIYMKKISRLLFGIPITKTTQSSHITQARANTMKLDGEVVAGNGARRYMLIKNDGTVDMSTLEGFIDSEYKVIDAVEIDGATLTAETIASLREQISLLEAKKAELTADSDKIEAEKTSYQTRIDELKNLYDLLSAQSYILEETVVSTIESNVKSAVVLGTNEQNSSKISQTVYNSIMSGYKTYVEQQYESDDAEFDDMTSMEAYLRNFKYNVQDGNGNDVETTLSETQITNLLTSFNNEYAKMSVNDDANISTYDGKVIVVSADDYTTIQDNLSSVITDLTAYKAEIENIQNTIDEQITSITTQITQNNNQISYLNDNPLKDLNIEKSAIEFDNLFVQPSKIELVGLQNDKIEGNGNFKIYAPNLVIDNYSNRDLIFKNIDLGISEGTGLIINGKNYEQYKNTLKPVNTPLPFSWIPEAPIGTYVHYIGDNGRSFANTNNIIINNYFDHSNPALSVEKAIASDIRISGYIHTPNKFEIFNDSGDISLLNYITSDSKNIIATQGSVTYDAEKTALDIKENDQIIAGEDVNIKAKTLTLNGKVQAGYGDRTITITEDMLSDLVVDPTTGICNMINLGGSNISAYLNETNNIKALYQDGKIVLFNTKQEGGSVNLSGSTVSGSGAIVYTNGFANVKIDNQTSKTLVVNNLENNRMVGLVSNAGTITDITNQGHTSSLTDVKSKGLLDIIGALTVGKNQKTTDDVTVNINTENGLKINEKISTLGDVISTIDVVGDLNINNAASSIIVDGIVNISDGDLVIKNEGTDLTVNNTITSENGDISLLNKNGKLLISQDASINNKNGDTTLSNAGIAGLNVSGEIKAQTGNINLENTAGELVVNSSVTGENGNVSINNSGEQGTSLTENAQIIAQGSSSKIEVTNTNGGITVSDGATISNTSGTDEDNLKISNSGSGLLSMLGSIFNKKGNAIVENTNTNSGVLISTTGNVAVEDGDITLANSASQGIDIEGKITDENGNILILNRNSNIEIGEYASDNDNYIYANNGNVVISQQNGDILNGIVDEGNVENNRNHDLANPDRAYKTLINANGNLELYVENGNVGNDTHFLDGKDSGFGINASTRDYTESINVNVSGTITADNRDNGLFNLRAKESDLNIDKINTDGNVMITAADWKQSDQNPTPSEEDYYHGYSVLNASADNTIPNITGKNISIISSDNIGLSSNHLTYNQLDGGSVSAMAENNLYISGVGDDSTIWQIIAKRGDLALTLDGDAAIREITGNGKLTLISKGQNLTVYDLGKISSLNSDDDILYPHDGLAFESGDVIPEQIELQVLDLKQANPADANSTLNIFNAYVKGSDSDSADVILKADNIIAHAYGAPSSVVSTNQNPNGFDANIGRTYANDITEPNAIGDLKASGINTVGDGNALVFDIQGVSESDVVAIGANPLLRKYNMQTPVISPKPEFENPNAFTSPVAKAVNVSISLNSGENSTTENRGMLITNLYADNAYIDTKDLNLDAVDTFITNYAEFRNGNRGATQNGYPISEDYRWLNIVDNDYRRNIANIYGIPLTSQMYTAKTGSFYLNMGDSVSQNTKAPIVVYNPYNVVLLPDTENSFYRLTYKDNKIQYTTTTKDFAEIDKSTHLPTKREFIRFTVDKNDGIVQASDKSKNGTQRIISVKDISRGGLLVVHDGSLKLNEKFFIDLSYNDISTRVEIEVVRVNADDMAGLKFINMDKVTANKILHMNMSLQATKDVRVKVSGI